MLRTKQRARRPVAETNSSRNQPVAHLGKRKNTQRSDRRQLEQLPPALPFEFFVFESSDHVGPSAKNSRRDGARPVSLHAETRTGNQAPNEQTLAHNAMRRRELSFKVALDVRHSRMMGDTRLDDWIDLRAPRVTPDTPAFPRHDDSASRAILTPFFSIA